MPSTTFCTSAYRGSGGVHPSNGKSRSMRGLLVWARATLGLPDPLGAGDLRGVEHFVLVRDQDREAMLLERAAPQFDVRELDRDQRDADVEGVIAVPQRRRPIAVQRQAGVPSKMPNGAAALCARSHRVRRPRRSPARRTGYWD